MTHSVTDCRESDVIPQQQQLDAEIEQGQQEQKHGEPTFSVPMTLWGPFMHWPKRVNDLTRW